MFLFTESDSRQDYEHRWQMDRYGGMIPTEENQKYWEKNFFYFVHHIFPIDEICKEMFAKRFI